jgi:hypothetical protein
MRKFFVTLSLLGIVVFAQAADEQTEGSVVYSASIGVATGKLKTFLNGGDNTPENTAGWSSEPLVRIGAHLDFSGTHHWGVVAQYNELNNDNLFVLRPLDYAYNFAEQWRVKAFWGIARYDLATPAYGYYLGGGLEWLYDDFGISIEGAYGDKVARDALLPGDPQLPEGTQEIFFDIYSINTSLNYYF